jgi:hypothetical protein
MGKKLISEQTCQFERSREQSIEVQSPLWETMNRHKKLAKRRN